MSTPRRRTRPLVAQPDDAELADAARSQAARLHEADRLDELLAEEHEADVEATVAALLADRPAELPAAGETTTAARLDSTTIAEPDATGTVLAIDEAADLYAVSVSTLYRRARAGDLPGAHKRPSPKGERWFVPVAAMDAAGYRRTTTTTPAAATPAPELAGLLDALRTLTDTLTDERRALMAATEDRGRAEREREEARLVAARTEGELAVERRRVEELTRELDEARARSERRWWRRT